MAFKYQALNDSRSSLNSLSSLGSSRSIDSPGAGGGGGRQRPRLEFSAAGTCGSTNRNSVAVMSEVVEERSTLYQYPAPPSLRKSERDGEGGGAKSDSNWRQSLQLEDAGEKTGKRSTFASSTTDTDTSSTSGSTTSTGSKVLKRKNCDFSDSSDAPANTQNTTYSSNVESETGLYIHSSVCSGGSGLKFSRQLSTASVGSGERQTGLPLNHHHNHSREHGKLFRVLQKFSNKRAQQRVEIESEKKARKSLQHGGNRTERGRDKENVGHQKCSHKNKQGKKAGRFPVSKSSDLLSGFSDVVYQDINTEVIDPLAIELEVEPDIIISNATTDRLLGGEELSLSYAHHDSSRVQKYHSVPPAYEVEEDDGTSRYKRASVRRTSSLNEGIFHGCGAMMDTGALAKSGVISLSRNDSKRKSHDLLLYQGES